MSTDEHFTPQHMATAQLLFQGDVTFLRGITKLEDLPEANLPEIAFIGRSNVGKSSLINAVCGRKTTARVSNTPGRTQELNFFRVGTRFHLVDMPGYGYAKAPKKKVDAWVKLVRKYLLGRTTLKRVYLLIDSRHGIKEADIEFMGMLNTAAVSYQCVLTKIDKIHPDEVAKIFEATKLALAKNPAAYPILLSTSSEKKQGMELLRGFILNAIDVTSH